MGYLIRMAPEVGVWLANVRDRDPAAADLIDEAVAALRVGGESVGPPLVVPVDDPPLNARPDLDATYGRQLERLTRVRRAVRQTAMRDELYRVCLEQSLGRDAAFVAIAAAAIGSLGDAMYRDAQLAAGLAEGRLHLAAYALGASASGMTFDDSQVPALLGEPVDGLLFSCVGVH